MEIGFLSGIYYIKTETLLKEEDYVALKRFDKPTFLKYLKTKGYGHGSQYVFLEEVLVQDAINVRNELLSYLDDPFLFSAFYADHDLANIKIAWKSLNHNVTVATYDKVSLLSIEGLKELYKNGNDKLLPLSYRPLMSKLGQIQVGELSDYLQTLEQTVYDYYESRAYAQKGYKELGIYLTIQKVMVNLKTLLKLKTRNADIAVFEKALLRENIVKKENWLELYNLEGPAFLNKIYVLFDDKILEGVQSFIETLNPTIINEKFTDYLLDKVSFYSLNTNSVGPIINYLYLKEVEAMKVKAIYHAK